MKAAGLSAVLLALALGACVHYAPAPPHPEAFAPGFDARALPGDPGGKAWTRAGLLALAVRQNPQILEARAKYATALAAARAAKAGAGPSLTLTAEYADQAPHWGWEAASDIPLDFGVRRSARITTAQLQALQAYYDYGEAIWSVRTAIDRALGDLDFARQERFLAQQSTQVRDDRVQRMQRRVDLGQDARTLLITAMTDAAAARRRLITADGDQEAALAALAKALGLSPAAVRSRVFPAPGQEEPSLAGLATWRRDAAASRRDVLRAVADYDLAEQALRTQIAIQYPALSVGPGYFYDHGVNKLPWTLSLALPPWDLNRKAIAQAEAARLDAGRSLEAAQANALGEVDAATAAFRQAWADLERARDHDAPLAAQAAAVADRLALAGEGDKVDALAARGALIDADLAANDARRAALAAKADLEDALRRSFDPAETAAILNALNDAKAAPAPVAKTGGAR
ncbi:TolC family protein [Phenylobacterium sp.]|uniref:TolC family protein n=1 Tax=Phenylobacterium sp. TaxID=1871053 RepID=UPI002F4031C5